MAGLEFDDARQAIEAEVVGGWPSANPLAIDNLRFTEPKPEETAPTWGRLVILDAESRQISLGTTPCHRFEGQIVAQLFTPEKRGTQEIRDLADTFLAIFLNANFVPREFSAGNSGRIQTRVGWATRDGINNGWYQMRAIVPFIRDKRAP